MMGHRTAAHSSSSSSTSGAARRLAALGSHLADTASTRSVVRRAAAGASAAAAAPLITASQIDDYCRDGFVLVSGLVPAAVVDAAVDEMWRQMSGAPKLLAADPWAKETRPRPRRGEPASWGGGWAGVVDGPAITASFTEELLAVAEVLASAYEAASPFPSVAHPIVAPAQTLAINIFPQVGAVKAGGGGGGGGGWQWPAPHTDGSGEHTSPRACRIQHMTYLRCSEGVHGGGGTVAWPGSSRRLESLYAADRERYHGWAALREQVPVVCTDIQPVEVQPRAGDVLYFDVMTAHSGSAVLPGLEPRLALNHKYGKLAGSPNIT
jgi:hypothetical protein